MKNKDIKLGMTVYHRTMVDWGVGKVLSECIVHKVEGCGRRIGRPGWIIHFPNSAKEKTIQYRKCRSYELRSTENSKKLLAFLKAQASLKGIDEEDEE